MTIPTISMLPTAPARTDAPATFISRADAFLAALVTMQSELNTSIGAMNTDIGGIAANVTAAQDAQTAAELAETNAEAAQAAAEAASNATEWVSGQSYSSGDVVYSPINYKSYRANTATSGTTDPSLSSDWTALGYDLPSQTGNAGKFLTTDGTDESWDDVSGVIVDEQIFTTSGTWTKPDNASFVCVQLIGGGGGGAAGNFAGDGASGGGGGAFVERIFPASSVGATETITIGAGGSGNTGGGNGTDGGTSSFGSLVDALGGKAGIRNNTLTGGLPYSTTTVDSITAAGAPASYAGYGGYANANGGKTIYGGAGGAGTKTIAKTGGVSVFGGNGGDSALSGSAGNGTQPGGGGGAVSDGGSGSGGNGAAGNARIISW